jgi:hypothetical protein
MLEYGEEAVTIDADSQDRQKPKAGPPELQAEGSLNLALGRDVFSAYWNKESPDIEISYDISLTQEKSVESHY